MLDKIFKYAAYLKLGRLVALKLLEAALLIADRDPEKEEKFEKELKKAQELVKELGSLLEKLGL